MQNLHSKAAHIGSYQKQAENLCKLKRRRQIHTWTNDNEGVGKKKIKEKNLQMQTN